LTKQRIRLEIWATTSALVLSFGFSVYAATGHWRPLPVLGVVFAAAGLALWVAVALRHIRHMAAARAEQARALQTCYSLAAVMSHAKHPISEARDQILRSIENLSGDCANLAQMLATLRRASVSATASAAVERPIVPAWDPPPEMKSIIEEVVSTADGMSQELSQMRTNARDLLGSIDDTACSMSRLEEFLKDMTRSGKDLEAATETANRVALEGTKAFEELERENEALIISVKEAGAAVDDLGRWSDEVGKIIEVIQDITDETNLLALNAAIIAAQAGEHGKAFGVVAEEIRGLAERTSSSTKEISDLVKAVQKNVSNVAQGMRKSLQSVERGEVLARNAGRVLEKVSETFEVSRSLAKEIAASTFEHRVDSTSVVKSINKVSEIAKRLEVDGSRERRASVGSVVTARVLTALTLPRQAPHSAVQASGAAVARESAGAACSVGLEERGAGAVQMIDRGEVVVERVRAALDSIAEEVTASIGTIEQVADLARSLVKGTFSGGDGILGRCWEIVGCSEDLRTRCRAFTDGDWRCFLLDDVACGLDQDSEVHGGRRCYDCPAFRANVQHLLAGVPERTSSKRQE
jgi:methyl-accepting chemotaxis protein